MKQLPLQRLVPRLAVPSVNCHGVTDRHFAHVLTVCFLSSPAGSEDERRRGSQGRDDDEEELLLAGELLQPLAEATKHPRREAPVTSQPRPRHGDVRARNIQ